MHRDTAQNQKGYCTTSKHIPTWALHLQRYAPNFNNVPHKIEQDTHLGTAPAEVCITVKGIVAWALHLQGYAKLAAC